MRLWVAGVLGLALMIKLASADDLTKRLCDEAKNYIDWCALQATLTDKDLLDKEYQALLNDKPLPESETSKGKFDQGCSDNINPLPLLKDIRRVHKSNISDDAIKVVGFAKAHGRAFRDMLREHPSIIDAVKQRAQIDLAEQCETLNIKADLDQSNIFVRYWRRFFSSQ